MAGKRYIVEIGTGIDLHGEDATKAACRAVKNAVSGSCLCGLFEIAGVEDLASIDVEILIAVPNPREVDLDRVMEEVPIGRKRARAVEGGMTAEGLCVPLFAPQCSRIVVANAAVTVLVDR